MISFKKQTNRCLIQSKAAISKTTIIIVEYAMMCFWGNYTSYYSNTNKNADISPAL